MFDHACPTCGRDQIEIAYGVWICEDCELSGITGQKADNLLKPMYQRGSICKTKECGATGACLHKWLDYWLQKEPWRFEKEQLDDRQFNTVIQRFLS